MGIVNANFVTLTCNGPECNKTVTFEAQQQQQVFAKEENAWVRSARVISRLLPEPGQQQPVSFLFCSDECDIKHAATGARNLPEPKRIIEGVANSAQVQAAAEAAKRAEQATADLKAGKPATVRVTA
jgi:hypothetical protein